MTTMTTQSFCPKLLVVLLTGAFAHMQAAADTPAAKFGLSSYFPASNDCKAYKEFGAVLY